MFSIFEILPEPAPQIRIVDVGAQWDPVAGEAYTALLKDGRATVLGFEPDVSECDRLNARGGGAHTYLPCVAGDGSRRTFYVCNDSRTSSLYEPNTPLLEKFNNLENLCRVVGTSEVETIRLDDQEQARDTDFLKLDVQGGEADVLRGAERVLEETVVVHTEVEFVPLYRRQPLFAEIDQLLRSLGFLFHKFAGLAGRSFQPIVVNNDLNRGLSQLLWADAVYVKSFLGFDQLLPAKLLKLAVILHEVYFSFDLSALALRHYDLQAGTRLADAYLERLVRAAWSPSRT